MTNTEIPVDKFQYLALIARGKLISEIDKEQDDLTDLFWEVIYDKIDSKELVNLGILGEVRKGKSTVSLYITWQILAYLDKMMKRKRSNIGRYTFSDQTEFLRFIKRQEMNVCIAIDEFNGMAETGLNSTTEAALFDYYSDVFAAQYVHRVCCSPATLVDKNTTIILTVLGKNEVEGVTRCRVAYRNPVDKTVQVLGHVDFNVRGLLDDAFYQKYYAKKMRRLELISKHGIRDVRELEFSRMTLMTWEKITGLTNSMTINRDLILSAVNDICRKDGRIYSELVKNEITQRVAGLAVLKKEVQKLNKKNPKTPEEHDDIQESKRIIVEMFTDRLREEDRLSQLYDEYLNIMEWEE